jgi:hypothetical protein
MTRKEGGFTKTGQDAWMAYNEGIPDKYFVKKVKWIATTTDGDHVIEEPCRSFFNKGETYMRLRIWKYVFATKEAAIGHVNKRISEIKYIKIPGEGKN